MKRYLCLAALLIPVLANARSLGELSFTPCTLTSEGSPTTVNALCSSLEVAENRSINDGRRIALSLAWVAPEAGEAAPDPVFLLAGGPGQSAKTSYPGLEGAFSDIAKYRNVILLDQRGTGNSNPLTCEYDEQDDMLDDSDAALIRQARECLDALSQHADVRHYTTTDAIADLDAVRAAIGADTINLIGISYGTRVAQQYMSTYPEHVRSVVLDGVVPNSLVLGQEHARNLQTAIVAQFDRCKQHVSCIENLGDPAAQLTALRTELREAPRIVHYRDATTGVSSEGEFGYPMLATLLRMYIYQPLIASTLPLLLHELINGNSDAAMAQSQMLLSSLGDAMAQGMGLSVTCTEDADELRPDPADADTVLGDDFVRHIKTQCSVWPRGTRPDNFREAVRGDTPVLLLSGQYDPVTPPRYGDDVAATLSNARHLVLSGQGHNVIGTGCTPKLVARFVETADPQAPDASCLDRLAITPPFSGHFGWEP